NTDGVDTARARVVEDGPPARHGDPVRVGRPRYRRAERDDGIPRHHCPQRRARRRLRQHGMGPRLEHDRRRLGGDAAGRHPVGRRRFLLSTPGGDGAGEPGLMCVFAAGAVLVLTIVVVGGLPPGYRPWADAVSRLGPRDEPYRVLARLGLSAYGALVVIGAGP